MINSKYIKLFFLTLCVVTIVSCGSKGEDGVDENPATKPDAAILISPVKDAECNQGNIISSTHSKIVFEWNDAKNADRYTLVIKNLETESIEEISTTKTNLITNLLRGVPYSWSIISSTNGVSDTNSSETWKFYNAGVAIENYAPFPAELVSPIMGSTVEVSTSINWTGNDIDNDIEEYDVYLATTNPPTTLKESTTNTSMDNLSLEANQIYYWQVVTKDKHGNNSQSPVFEFRTK
ncbi:hypothetical protein [Polaribacter sp. SA4-12]|uniref:hypothetical protein n=1 Tax=Polaribacter sp. SA4-12 TaxID=1312072 RepID=UPI000B3C7BE3|nr:hypothetical protein [Polaribacter sp. SA4-12]ARV16595.1 hypothetical protein BTO07_16265 [Polaribacter sp. SA4-12]